MGVVELMKCKNLKICAYD